MKRYRDRRSARSRRTCTLLHRRARLKPSFPQSPFPTTTPCTLLHRRARLKPSFPQSPFPTTTPCTLLHRRARLKRLRLCVRRRRQRPPCTLLHRRARLKRPQTPPMAGRLLGSCTLLHRRARLKHHELWVRPGADGHALHPPSQEGSIEAARSSQASPTFVVPAPSFTGGLD